MKRKILTSLACLTLAAYLLVGCAETEKPAETDEQNEQSEQVEQIENEEEIQGEAETDSGYEPTTVSDPDAPPFDIIYNANQFENVLSVYGAIKYITTYGNGEQEDEGEYITANGVYKPIVLPGTESEESTDGFDFFFGSSQEPNGYAFYNENSYYVTDGTDFYAVLDTGDTYSTNGYGNFYNEFYGWDSSEVESITKTETGWQIKFNPEVENAKFFRDEEYQDGDLFVVYEYVNENLILDYRKQVIECADGTVEELNRTTLIGGELPEIAKKMSEHANPSEEDTYPVIVFVDDGMGNVKANKCFITYGDRCQILTDGYLIYADKEYTLYLENASFVENCLVAYAVSPVSLFMKDTEILSVPGVIGYTVTAYDSDGNEIAKNSVMNGNDWSSRDIGGNFYDESIAYIECTLYNGEWEPIGETVRIDK